MDVNVILLRWAKFLPNGTAPDAKERKLLHQLECCEEEVCLNQKTRTIEEIAEALKAAKSNPSTTNNNKTKIMPHLNPLLTAYRKNREAMEKKDEEEENDEEDSNESVESEDSEDEEDEEELFYKTFVLHSDDMWEALHEEEQKIEEFFQMRRKK